jgi:hypothetical protein
MNVKDILMDLNRRHKRELAARRDAATLWKTEGRIASDSVVELSSLDKTVAFFDDRLETTIKLGDTHRVIPYRTIRAVSLKKKRVASISVGDRAVFETSGGPDSIMVLVVEARLRPLVFDFRSEPAGRVEEAVALIQRHARRTADESKYDDDAPSFLSPLPRSRADELAKLAALRDAGILTAAEFETEKARILKS